MYLDTRSHDADDLRCDICTVGGGPAGIAMAHDLIGSGFAVVLLEAGGFEIDADSQAIYEGDVIGHDFPPLDVARLRFFGGASNHWQGMSRPLDALDFEPRAHVPRSGWPIRRDELDEHYERAARYCELGNGRYGLDEVADVMGRPLDWALDGGVFRHSPPTRFGEAYRAALGAADDVRVFLHANVTSIELDRDATAVDHLVVQTFSGRRLTVRARQYVLACGGIENARLLLNSDSVMAGGVGNGFDCVGRFFMDHPFAPHTAEMHLLRSDAGINFYHHHFDPDGVHLRGFIGLPPAMQHRRETLNCGFILDRYNFTAASEGIQSAKAILADFPERFGEHVWNIVGDLDGLAGAAWRKAVYSVHTRFRVSFFMENMPDWNSRVMLTGDRDRFGMRRVAVDWRIDDGHLHTYQVAHEELAAEMGRTGLGRLELKKPGDTVAGIGFDSSFHHMGTTRMHDDPRQGVVDRDSRGLGVANLYVAGSSVFTTAGHTNPTLNLVALALRLGDHLRRVA